MGGRSMVSELGDAYLYGILDLGYVDETNIEHVAKELLEGGVGLLQLRAKGYSEDAVRRLFDGPALSLSELCRGYGVPLIINDFPEVAVAVGADGVHIGQGDGSLLEVREVVGDAMIVGRSTHSPDQAREAMREGFDYIGFGPLFPTPTKEGRLAIGLDGVAEVQREVGVNIPVFCIGGIKPENLELVLASGARRVVIVSALLQAEDIASSVCGILKSLKTNP